MCGGAATSSALTLFTTNWVPATLPETVMKVIRRPFERSSVLEQGEKQLSNRERKEGSNRERNNLATTERERKETPKRETT